MQIKYSIFIGCSLLFLFTLLTSACGDSESSSAQNETDPKTEQTHDSPQVVTTSNTDTEPEEQKNTATEPSIETEKGSGDLMEEEPKVEAAPEKTEKKAPKKRAKIYFKEKMYDFGFIMQGDTVFHDFQFKNVGNDDLLITRVETSCGCTVPIYPREPIPPGEGGKISVVFKSAGKLGRQVPTVSVFTNYKRKIKLELKGIVDAERAKPTPPVQEKKDTVQ